MEKIPLLRGLVFVCGCLFLGLGLIGVVVRGLPTTPMLLLSVGCFSRSSDRMNRWIHSHPKLGPFLRDLETGEGIPLRVKVYSMTLAWLLLGGTALFLTSSLWLRILLFGIASVKTVLMIWIIPTKSPAPETEGPDNPIT